MTTEETVKTTVRIRKSLLREVQHRAIDEELSQQQIIERALEAYLRTSVRRATGRKETRK